MGFFDKLRQGLSRTTQQLVGRFEELVEQSDAVPDRTRPIDVDTLEALEELLLSADVGVPATERIVTAVRGRAASAARACGSWSSARSGRSSTARRRPRPTAPGRTSRSSSA